MTLHQRLDLLAELGHFIRSGGDEDLDQAIQQSYFENKWFTEENTRKALNAIANEFLEKPKLEAWVTQYRHSSLGHSSLGAEPNDPMTTNDLMTNGPMTKTVALIMAGNIPLVGFYDWLCMFVAGYRAKVKLSDKDKRLLPVLVKKMGEWVHESWAYTEFLGENERLVNFDAVIATGSNNTARYFEQYFGKYPHIIRRNRNAVAVLSGMETAAELHALGQDIFSYFGLGCRNVSKICVPHGYHFDTLLEALHEYREIIHHDKYKNNFDYNFTLYIMNGLPHKNNGCLLLKEDPSLQARIASVHYEYYDDLQELDALLAAKRDEIQCVVGKVNVKGFTVLPFGESQRPTLNDYPDGVDVMRFLITP
ncbi:MAG: acyl-CoA reductase [Phycisphaerae bacterium]|nr:acyl-CoA reductase [Saprospiraceae bacterium]